MIPILYGSTETAFTSNGIGRLAEARKCEVKEVRNGEYELALEYPINGKLLGSIICGNFIKATHDNTGKAQPFQIYEVSEPIEGFVTVRAWHISYALNAIVVKPFTATSCADAISKISANAIGTCPFTFWTDKSVTANFTNSVPKSIRSLLGGSEGSILDTYGKGEYEFDGFDVKLWLNRGVDRGVKIKYGKNLLSLDRQLDASNVYNAVVPFWTDDETTVSLDHAVVRTGETAGRTIPLDLSDEWDEAPTTTQLENKAQAHVDATSNYELKENLKVSFVQLWQTEEYKDIANLERINLCDTVTIEYLRRGITATAKCIKVVYDTLRERYVSMELGEPRTSLAQQINTDVVQPAVAMLPDRASVKGAIDRATELISGGFGGYIKYKYLVDGTPSEMLIMDSASEATATNIIRLNQNGIGFSTDGGVTYANAWTIDGHLNADFITTGKIEDASGLNFWNLVSGQFQTQQGKIGPFTIDTDGLKYFVNNLERVLIGTTGLRYGDRSSWQTSWRSTYGQKVLFERYYNDDWHETVALEQTTIQDNNNDLRSVAMLKIDGHVNLWLSDYEWRIEHARGFKNDIGGNTWVQGILCASGNNPDVLWTGDLETAGSVDVYYYGLYSFYVIEGVPSGGARQTMIIPQKAITTSSKWYQLCDDSGGVGFTVSHDTPAQPTTPSQLTVTYSNKWGGGTITAIYGII